jgi:aerotaxis receptor
MRAKEIESPFAFEELFFSKTNEKGIIKSGNSVFQRVSEFSWEELINRPHNVIRHPDMPRAVFYVLWKFLRAGKPIGAFVKNRSKSGRYYWVYALALPVDSGYLSVRLKPGGTLLATIATEYENLKRAESAKNLKPEQSAELLLARLKELEFKDYESFMIEALVDQLNFRSKQLGQSLSAELKEMTELMLASQQTIQAAEQILIAFNESKFVPLNLEVHAARLGEVGRQISVVANQYQKMVLEINEQIEKLGTMSSEVLNQVNTGRFLLGSSELLSEIRRYLAIENADANTNGMGDIETLISKYIVESQNGVKKILDVVVNFASICEELQTLGSGLELVRITGKIESASLSHASDVNDMLNSLRKFQLALGGGLKDILSKNAVMKKQSEGLLQRIKKRRLPGHSR